MKQVLAIQKLEKNHKQKSCFWKKIDANVTMLFFTAANYWVLKKVD